MVTIEGWEADIFHNALDGVLVVAVEQAVAAPYCTSRLADAGARVLKVERQDGDFARRYDAAAGGESAYFVWLNRGKESICLDLKAEDDIALLKRLIARADVFVQNLAPGAAERLGVGSADLRAKHERLITVDVSGYGEGGAYEAMKAYDLLVQCESGLASITGTPDGPGRVGVSVCDIACGMYAYSGVLQALIARGRTGQGASLKVSLFDAIADWMAVPLMQHEGGVTSKRVGLNHPTIAPYGAYACGDGQLVVFSVQSQAEWQRFCAAVLEDPSVADDARFAGNADRLANRQALDQLIERCFQALTRGDVAARLQTARMGYAELRDLDGLVAHPALRRMEQDLPSGSVLGVQPPVQWADGTTFTARSVPALDEHGLAIRREFSDLQASV